MTNAVPTWLQRLLGIQTGRGEGTAWSLEHTWSWPPWLTLLFVVFAVAFVITTYLRENREASVTLRMLLATIRLALVGIVLFMLAQFALSFSRTGLPYVAVLVDDSLSMTIVDRYDDALHKKLLERIRHEGLDEPSRWNLARTLLTERNGSLLTALTKNYKLRFYFLTGITPSQTGDVDELVKQLKSHDPAGETSRLGTAVRGVLEDLRGTAPAAIILLSDGINTDGPTLSDAATTARRKGVPLFCIGLGDNRPVRDLKLSDLIVEDVVFLNDIVYFEANLTASGYADREVRVVLRRKDMPQILAEQKLKAPPDGQSLQVRLAHRPTEEGQFPFIVEVEPLEGELETENNRQERTVRVRKEQIRVLLVQASPSYEFRYLRNMLQRDATVELHTVLQEADMEHAEQVEGVLRGFPVRRDELFKYDVIILGDVNPGLLSASMLQNVADFVDQPGKGGALVCIAGPQFMPAAFRNSPLERLLPINLNTIRYPDPNVTLTEGFGVRPTDLGLVSPQMQLGDTPAETARIWENLPPLYWLLETPDLKPGARVLAEHPNKLAHDGRRLPVIVMHYVGAGKVLFHATDETWRWRYRVGDVFFARYWIQTIRFLARSKLAESGSALLSVDRREYQRGEPVLLRARFIDERLAPADDDGVTIVLEHKDHQTQRLQLHRVTTNRGVFEGLLSKPAIGSYHAWIALPASQGPAPAVDFSVVAPPGEFQKVEMDAAELRRAAEMTKGKFYDVTTAARILRDLPEGRQVPIESLPPKSLWNTWPLLLLFLALLTTEWTLRKLGGMA